MRSSVPSSIPASCALILIVSFASACASVEDFAADARTGIDANTADANTVDAAMDDASAADSNVPDADRSDATASDTDAGGVGPLEPATDACAIAAADPTSALAAGACKAIGAFARGQFQEPFDILLGDVSARRFGVAALSNLWPSYQRALAVMPDVELRTYARVGDAAAQVTTAELATLTFIDAYTGPALHCRDHPLPPDFGATLAQNVVSGGYNATHVLLALIWLRDGACVSPADDQLVEATVTAAASCIDTDHSVTTDLEMEAAALLTYFGEGQRIPAGYLEAVLATQMSDGGWGEFDTASGHTSGLALWYLHEHLVPGRHTPMVNPSARAP